MALVVCHSPKGGTGTTFIAAHLAMGLAERGADVTLLTVNPADTMALHFGVDPAMQLPSLEGQAFVVSTVSLRSHVAAATDTAFVRTLSELEFLRPRSERCLVIDVPSGCRDLAKALQSHAAAVVCPLSVAPDCIALLPGLIEQIGMDQLARTFFAINGLDETRRLARHGATFLGELLGARLIARIRRDEAVPEAIAMLQPLARYAPSSIALADTRAIADEVFTAIAPRNETSGAPVSNESRAA
jgi:cellulose biosynthesis protein BcsQ